MAVATKDIQLTGYLCDDVGNIIGIRFRGDEGHGYGFNNGWKEFALKSGDTYEFRHEYTAIDGPSDWSDGSYYVRIKLIEEE